MLKKVAIISRHAVPNYGSLMQAVALQKAVQTVEGIPFYIDAEFCYYDAHAIAKAAMNTSKYRRIPGLNIASYITKYYRYKEPIRLFREYQKKWLVLSERQYITKSELMDNPPDADVYMVGSDQVWNIMPDGKVEYSYFFDFVERSKRKVSYAASFGSVEKIRDELPSMYEYLKRFDMITVREKDAISILDAIDLRGVQVLDPTFLLNASAWDELASSPGRNGEYLLLYQVNHNKDICLFAEKVAKRLGIELIRISNDFSEKKWAGGFLYLPSPAEWLALFRDASYVITDSFHGTCFCLQFHKRFIDILPEQHSQRNRSILQLVGLDNRIATKEKYDVLFENIDWNTVDSILEEQKYASMDCLRTMIGG